MACSEAKRLPHHLPTAFQTYFDLWLLLIPPKYGVQEKLQVSYNVQLRIEVMDTKQLIFM